MTYAISDALQQAVYQTLLAIRLSPPWWAQTSMTPCQRGACRSPMSALDLKEVQEASDKDGAGARHELTISVVTDTSGFQLAKEVAGAICDALIDAQLSLNRGHLVGLWFLRAKAARSNSGTSRRIDLTFRARVQDI